MDKKAMFHLTYGLFVLTAKDGDKDNGCIVNTIMQVTDTPTQIIVAVNKNNYTHDMIANTGVFNVCVLTEKAQFDTYEQWGYQSGANVDKTKGIVYKRAKNDVIYLDKETNAYISGKVLEQMDLQTHTLFLAEVTEAVVLSNDKSVTYQFYQDNIKPKPTSDKKSGFICEVCGYVYEGDTLPEDYICPICKHPSSDFRPL